MESSRESASRGGITSSRHYGGWRQLTGANLNQPFAVCRNVNDDINSRTASDSNLMAWGLFVSSQIIPKHLLCRCRRHVVWKTDKTFKTRGPFDVCQYYRSINDNHWLTVLSRRWFITILTKWTYCPTQCHDIEFYSVFFWMSSSALTPNASCRAYKFKFINK